MYGPYGIYLAELYQFPKLKIAISLKKGWKLLRGRYDCVNFVRHGSFRYNDSMNVKWSKTGGKTRKILHPRNHKWVTLTPFTIGHGFVWNEGYLLIGFLQGENDDKPEEFLGALFSDKSTFPWPRLLIAVGITHFTIPWMTQSCLICRMCAAYLNLA